MKKVKLLTPILTIVGISSITAPLITLTSCSSKELKISQTIDSHIERIDFEGKLEVGKEIIVNVTLKEDAIATGWGTVDKANTVIKNGSKTLKIGEGYEINANNQITIKAGVLTANDLSLDIKTAPTTYTFEYEWKDVLAVNENLTVLGIPGNKITAANLDIEAINGKGEKIKAEPGEGLNQYQIYYDGQNVTSQFTGSGFEFTESMVSGGVSDLYFEVQVKLDKGTESSVLLAKCGHKPASIDINQNDLADPKGSYVEAIVPKSDDYAYSKFEIVTEGTTVTGAKVEQALDGNWYVYWDEGSVGTIKLKVSSLVDSTIYKEKEFAIK